MYWYMNVEVIIVRYCNLNNVIFTFFQAVQIQKRDFTMFECLMLVNHPKNEGGFWELRESSPPKDR